MIMPEPLIKTKEIDVLTDRLPASEEDTANGLDARRRQAGCP